jgi:hypothetical protein
MAWDVQIMNGIHDLRLRIVDLQTGKVNTHPDVVELVAAAVAAVSWRTHRRNEKTRRMTAGGSSGYSGWDDRP